jgi:hypothetical protein
MNGARFDRLSRTITRRNGLGLLAAFGLANIAAAQASAKKKKTLKKNEYGCVNVGGTCRGKDANCCSGICDGKKPKKGKKDKSRCVAHNVLGCQAGQDQCAGNSAPCGSGPMGFCYRTTGNAGYCGEAGGCLDCQTDADCVAHGGFGAGAACVVCQDECALTGGTACFAAAP